MSELSVNCFVPSRIGTQCKLLRGEAKRVYPEKRSDEGFFKKEEIVSSRRPREFPHWIRIGGYTSEPEPETVVEIIAYERRTYIEYEVFLPNSWVEGHSSQRPERVSFGRLYAYIEPLFGEPSNYKEYEKFEEEDWNSLEAFFNTYSFAPRIGAIPIGWYFQYRHIELAYKLFWKDPRRFREIVEAAETLDGFFALAALEF